MKYYQYFAAVCLCAPWLALAAPPEPPLSVPSEPERYFDVSQPPSRPVMPVEQSPAATEGKTISMSKEELLANPQLLQLALDSALSLDHVENVRFLLPLYRQLPERDPVLLLYAEAVVARADGDLDGAIARYRQIIAERPELTPMRLLLAVALFENHEDTAAADQFEKIRAEKDLPPEVTNVANQYLSALQARQSWSFNAGLQYLQDSNINNAPRERYYGHWKMPEPEAAHGIGYRASLEKTFPLRNGWNTQLGLELDGKSYWDNHRYDEITARAYGGVGYRNLRSQVALLPFFEKKWYGGDSYANMPGFRLQASHWLHPRWQVLGALEYGRKYQQQYKYLDGNSYLGSATAVYLASPRQYWIAGLDLGRETAQDADSTYNRAGVRGGWGQEWGKGVSTLLVAGAAKRRYEDKAWARDEMRRDTEYFATASVWLRDLHWYGLTPRLNVAWQRYSSNHFMYNYQKTKVFIEVSKKF